MIKREYEVRKRKCNQEQKEASFHSFDTFSYFGYILSYNNRIEMILEDRSAFGMKTSKSNSVIFLVKKLKYKSENSGSKAETEL